MQYCKLPKIVHYSTEEVSSFAKINKLFTPTGCAKTLKAKTDHIEAEIAETQKHQKEFDFQIKKEYEKLFSPLNLNIKSQLFRKYSKKLPKLKAALNAKGNQATNNSHQAFLIKFSLPRPLCK